MLCGSAWAQPTASASASGVGWFVIRDASPGWGGGIGTGSFLSFQSTNRVGLWGDWALINGGLVDRTPGSEQGDLDFAVHVDGKAEAIGVQGAFYGYQPAVFPSRELFDLGRPYARFKDLYLSGAVKQSSATCPASVPAGVTSCIRAYVDNVEVFIPVFK